MSKALANLPIPDLARSIKAGQLSPLELMENCLERIEAHNPQLNAFSQVFAEQARESARRAGQEIAAGKWRGPLHGIPFAAKELFDSKGHRCHAGSLVWKDYVATEDAQAVHRLKAAGAILLGRVHMQEFAFGVTGENPHYGPVRNPWDTARMTGGSSSGSAAAVAAGLIPLALGTDTGGSVRVPSSLCGISGLKTTYGLVSRRGALPLAWSLDTVGPMARHASSLAVALSALAGHDPLCPGSLAQEPRDYLAACEAQDLRGLRVGRPSSFFYEQVHPEVLAGVERFLSRLEDLGAEVRPVELQDIEQADKAAMAVLFSEAAACLEEHLREHPQLVSEDVAANVRLGLCIPASRYIQALRARRKLRAHLAQVFEHIDVLVTPATTVAAPALEDTQVEMASGLKLDVRSALTSCTRYFNLAALPALVLPCGQTSQKLPVGVQIAAGHLGEETLLRLGRVYQRAFPPAASPFAEDI